MEREHISAWMDGELDDAAQSKALRQCQSDESILHVWNEYHLIGDILREQDIHPVRIGEEISRKLASEPTILAPRTFKTPEWLQPSRWLAVAAAVGLIALTTWTLRPAVQGAAPTVLAQGAAPASAAPAVVRSSDVDAYVALHHQWSPISGFQTVDYNTRIDPSR
jgi:sigma-E factor negative regulatory protein RseA